MKTLIGVLIIILGVVVGIYVGLVLCLVGGITQLLDAVQQDPVPSRDVAWGVVRILASGVAGMASFWLTAVVGMVLISDDSSISRRSRRSRQQQKQRVKLAKARRRANERPL